MRVLYASPGRSAHDISFADAWRDGGVELATVAMPDGSLDRIAEAIRQFEPDVVQAGPLHDVAYAVRQVWSGPLLATSWSFDVLRDAADPALRARMAEVLQGAEGVMVDGDATRAAAVELGADDNRIAQFPWGVDLDAFSPGPSMTRDKLGWARENLVVLCSHPHEDMYRVDLVLEAFLTAATESRQFRLMLSGTGTHTERYERAAIDAGCAERVAFLGRIGGTALRDAYRAADLYVSAAENEGSSVSLLAAMACGTPVCAASVAGNAQWVTKETGCSFTPGDANDLADQLTAIRDADRSIERKGQVQRALSRVRQEADWSTNRKRLPELARDAIAAAERCGMRGASS